MARQALRAGNPQAELPGARTRVTLELTCTPGHWPGTRRFSGARPEPGANARSAALALIPMGDWCGSVPQPDKRETGCVIMLRFTARPGPNSFTTTQDMRHGRYLPLYLGLYCRNGDKFIAVYDRARINRTRIPSPELSGSSSVLQRCRSFCASVRRARRSGSCRDQSGGPIRLRKSSRVSGFAPRAAS
jgi:hypothetical protein